QEEKVPTRTDEESLPVDSPFPEMCNCGCCTKGPTLASPEFRLAGPKTLRLAGRPLSSQQTQYYARLHSQSPFRVQQYGQPCIVPCVRPGGAKSNHLISAVSLQRYRNVTRCFRTCSKFTKMFHNSGVPRLQSNKIGRDRTSELGTPLPPPRASAV